MQIRVQNKRKSVRKSRYVGDVSHLRVLHMFSSMMSLELLIQQSAEEVYEFHQHDSVVMVMVK